MTADLRTCRGCKNQFAVGPDDLAFYERVNAPPPSFCPDCRMQRRLAHRNERTLYRRACDLCKKEGVSIYPDGTPFPVYCAPCWWGDGWDPKSFALDYDSSKPFFEQWKVLQDRVPRIALLSITSVNSEYTNNSGDNKNCYLLFAAERNEDSMYGRLIQRSKQIVDGSFIYDSERCYDCVDCRQCYNCFYSERCQTSTDLLFCFNLRDSQNCILSTNLRHGQYYVRNRQVSKEEYEAERAKILASHESVEAARKELEELKARTIVKFAFQTKCVNATGDYLFNCHDAKRVFDASNAKNCAYLADAEDPIDCYDGNNLYYKPELCYDFMGILQCYGAKYSSYVLYCTDVEYCDSCQNCESLFGCIGMRKSKYCILNKEYSKEEYEKLKASIVETLKKDGLYGGFLPPELSPFGYNETLAVDYFPLTKEAAAERGFRWQERETGTYGKETVQRGAMPSSIDEVDDSILQAILVCETCNRNFRITPAELQFYRQMHLPLPRNDFECRHRARMARRTPRKLWERACECTGASAARGDYKNTATHVHHGAEKCPNTFETAYAADRSEIVYCEPCYQAEVS